MFRKTRPTKPTTKPIPNNPPHQPQALRTIRASKQPQRSWTPTSFFTLLSQRYLASADLRSEAFQRLGKLLSRRSGTHLSLVATRPSTIGRNTSLYLWYLEKKLSRSTRCLVRLRTCWKKQVHFATRTASHWSATNALSHVTTQNFSNVGTSSSPIRP